MQRATWHFRLGTKFTCFQVLHIMLKFTDTRQIFQGKMPRLKLHGDVARVAAKGPYFLGSRRSRESPGEHEPSSPGRQRPLRGSLRRLGPGGHHLLPQHHRQEPSQPNQLHPGAAQRAGAPLRGDALSRRLHEGGAQPEAGAVRG